MSITSTPYLAGIPLYLVWRGPTQAAGLTCSTDRDVFTQRLMSGVELFRIRIHAYSVMPQHVELLIEATQAEQLREFVEWLCGQCEMPTARLRSFDCAPVERTTFLNKCLEYIVWMPVLDGYSAVPSEYQWSSVYLNPDVRADSHCEVHDALSDYPVTNLTTGAFDRPSSYVIKRITHALTHGYPLGGAKFRQKIEAMLRANSQWQPQRCEYNYRYTK